jgi:hypothetical protein
VNDPIRFTRSSDGRSSTAHANNFAKRYASVAYWYQTEPHGPFPALPAREALRPPLPSDYAEARDAFMHAVTEAVRTFSPTEMHRLAGIGEPFYAGRFAETLAGCAKAEC